MLRPDTAPHGPRLVRRLESIAPLSDQDREALLTLPLELRRYAKGEDLVRDHARPHECCLVLDGFVCRYKVLADGRRQILSFHIPGDMADLESLHLHVVDHSVRAMTPTVAAFIEHSLLRDATQRLPGLLHALWRQTLIDAAIFREWIVSLGRRDARQRITHLLCEMLLRYEAVGLAPGGCFDLPLTQSEFGDALGLSTVHVNRVVQDLRAEGLITWRRSSVTVLDREALQAACDFDPVYLHQHPREGG